ncbi:MAG: GxxExxY protein [Gammaproteobacteria bacterium]|nr:GxxExxY protein [Gammaproteobacteria bacterium]MDH5652534.1 GxxExxY protein [Gammaproteobacteria bacterium]
MRENEITEQIIGAAIDVHRELGPGLLETVYHQCLAHEFGLRGIKYDSELVFGARYKGKSIPSAFRMDFLVCDSVVVELKVVENILPVHSAQLLSYLRLSSKEIGLLINFNVPVLKQGIKRVVNNKQQKTSVTSAFSVPLR